MLKAKPYSINVSDDKSKADKLFVENIENIILNQGSGFRSQHHNDTSAFDQSQQQQQQQQEK